MATKAERALSYFEPLRCDSGEHDHQFHTFSTLYTEAIEKTHQNPVVRNLVTLRAETVSPKKEQDGKSDYVEKNDKAPFLRSELSYSIRSSEIPLPGQAKPNSIESGETPLPPGYVPESFLLEQFPYAGQGVFGVHYAATGSFRLVLSNIKDLSMGKKQRVLVLDIIENGAFFRDANNSLDESLLGDQYEKAPDGTPLAKKTGRGRTTLDKGTEATKVSTDGAHHYWISIDKANKVLRYGRGYQTSSLTLLEVNLGPEPERAGEAWQSWMNDVKYLAIADIHRGSIGTQTVEERKFRVDIWPMPVDEHSPIVVHRDKITLEQLESGAVTVVENLDVECQRLYANVAGQNIRLDEEDFPDFSAATQRSVMTEGCIAYKRLQDKAKEHAHQEGPDIVKGQIKNTYLRVTLGLNKGNSPGSPYVMEIWPSGHQSPVHNHSNAYAIIKVLHGEINCHYYPELDTNKTAGQYYRKCTFKKDDVTWISNTQLQTHQLKNESNRVCVTIQCYQYGAADKEHYEYFDFLEEGTKEVTKFTPNSDWTYGAFKKLIRDEWEGYLRNS